MRQRKQQAKSIIETHDQEDIHMITQHLKGKVTSDQLDQYIINKRAKDYV